MAGSIVAPLAAIPATATPSRPNPCRQLSGFLKLFEQQPFYGQIAWVGLPDRFVGAEERVFLWHRNPPDGRDGLVVLLKASTAFVVRASRWVSADDQKVTARLETFMPNACWHNNHVASSDLYRFSFVSSQAHDCLTARDTQHFVNHRVVMHKIIDPIAPRLAP
jgi:hypothetical protein